MIPNGNITVESLIQAIKKRILIKVLSVYADDSSDEKGERIFAIAGIMGTQEEWDALEVKWIARSRGEVFHATDCESDQGVYKDIPHKENQELYKDLTQLLAQSSLLGFGVAMDVGAYKALLPGVFKEAPYFHCFSRVIGYFGKKVFERDVQQKVKFVFDINHKVKYTAAYLYNNFLIDCKDWEYCSCLEDEIGFATRRTVGIQVADLFTKETMKHFDNQFGPVKRPIRKSLIELLKTNRFFCDYYTKEWFEGFSTNLESIQRFYGMEQEKYEKWLLNHKRQDTGENRVNFLIDLDSEESSNS